MNYKKYIANTYTAIPKYCYFTIYYLFVCLFCPSYHQDYFPGVCATEN